MGEQSNLPSFRRAKRKQAAFARLLGVWTTAVFLLIGCAPKQEKPQAEGPCGQGRPFVEKGNSDQFCSYEVPVSTSNALTVSVDRNFSDEEKEQVTAAIQTWNTLTSKVLGGEIFKAQFDVDFSESQKPKNVQDCGFPGSGSSFSIVKEVSQERWLARGFLPHNLATTIRCFVPDAVQRQVVMVQNGLPGFQFQSVITHELGHVLGLDHSCSPTAKNHYVGCGQLTLDHPYRQAIMYPVLDFGAVKENLQSNDLDRAEILLSQ